jgi:hypothetical protein
MVLGQALIGQGSRAWVLTQVVAQQVALVASSTVLNNFYGAILWPGAGHKQFRRKDYDDKAKPLVKRGASNG